MNKKAKLILWHGLVMVVAVALWFDVAAWLKVVSVEGDFASYAVVFFALLVSLVGLGFVMFPVKRWALTFSLLIWGMFVVNFGWSYLYLIGLGILILAALRSVADVKGEVSERIKIKSRVILRRAVLPIILGLFVLTSFAAYESPAFDKFRNMDSLPGETEGYIKTVVENTIGRNIKVRNETERRSVIDQVSKETTRELNTFLSPYFKYAPPVLAFALFLILWGLSWVFIWISVGVGTFVFWILKRSGFIKIEERDTRAEILII